MWESTVDNAHDISSLKFQEQSKNQLNCRMPKIVVSLVRVNLFEFYLTMDGSTLMKTTTSTGNEPSNAGEPIDVVEALRSILLKTLSMTFISGPSGILQK